MKAFLGVTLVVALVAFVLVVGAWLSIVVTVFEGTR